MQTSDEASNRPPHLCSVCVQAIEGTKDPAITPRLGATRESCSTSTKDSTEIKSYVYGHHRTKESLEQSAVSGCHVCSHIVNNEGLTESSEGGEELEGDQDETGFFTTFQLIPSMRGRSMNMKLRCSETSGKFWYIYFRKIEHNPHGITLLKDLDKNTGGPKAWSIAKDWIGHCVENHERCTSVRDTSFLPTRLINFQLIEGILEYRVVLRGMECPASSRYIAISYVWGCGPLNEKTRLLQSNWDSFREFRPVATLPKTFADAIEIAARMNIDLIWIDSLCIIQDSEFDWRAEAASMQSVYRHSTLTLVALVGADDNSGLFYDRDPRTVVYTRITIEIDTPAVFRLEDDDDIYIEASLAMRSFTRHAKSIGRAWCFQERLLSPRCLYFGHEQLFWECRDLRASEAHPSDLHPTSPLRLPLWKHIFEDLVGSHPHVLEAPKYETRVLEEWYFALEKYSNCQATFPRDRLIAISGVAKDVQQALGSLDPPVNCSYLAGLWAHDLRWGLCWYNNTGPRRSGIRAAQSRAPTWSWASITGSVYTNPPTPLNPPTPEDRDYLWWYVTEKNCSGWTKNVDDVDTREVLDGRISITVPLLKIHISTVANEDYHVSHNRGVFSVGTTVTAYAITLFGSIQTPRGSFDSVSRLDDGVRPAAVVIFDVAEEVTQEAFCAPMFQHGRFGVSKIEGLVLLASESAESIDAYKTYKRIGYFICGGETAWKGLSNLIERFLPRSISIH